MTISSHKRFSQAASTKERYIRPSEVVKVDIYPSLSLLLTKQKASKAQHTEYRMSGSRPELRIPRKTAYVLLKLFEDEHAGEKQSARPKNPFTKSPILFTPNVMQRCRCAAKHDIEGAITLAAVALTIGKFGAWQVRRGLNASCGRSNISDIKLPVFRQWLGLAVWD